ncbi:FimB/Mfa2 family fimbrial subunit [Pedobacter sp. N36a]|uniref:FimB/Mfa2 family fimbrial subunit n=1 Tax=Pedobacter sp. N36a TaxID=2767996 RepID=UPI001656DDDC|nr:FimB/Mfa2 family fimbrial subunit [Pedobacter sp. N36a]MBC8986318.1 FimB/Mfa2 family fimbrial subunit [Pedobacter sp. N36a]
MRRTCAFAMILALMVLTQACIKEKLEDCELKVALHFTQADSCSNQPIYRKTGYLNVFAFNQKGILSGRFSNAGISFGSDEHIVLNLKSGDYTLVAVSGLTEQLFASQRLVNGQTHISEFYIPSYIGKDGEKETENSPFFIGVAQQVNLSQSKPYSVAMKLISKPINLVLNGRPANRSYQARISFNATLYSLKNDFTFRFAQDHFTMANLHADALKHNVYHANTGMLWPGKNQDSRLIIRDLLEGVDIFNVDITSLLARFNHVDFQCEPEINIEINGSITPDIEIVINGWKVQYSEMEL